jgi:hypothetical protein
MRLTKEQAQELVCGDSPYLVIAEVSVGTGRWSETRRVIFLDGERVLWAFDYQRGLTENQDTEIEAGEAFRVKAVPVSAVEYVRVK